MRRKREDLLDVGFIKRGLFISVLIAGLAQGEVTARVAPTAALPVTSPTRDYFGIGGDLDLAGLYGLTSWLDLGIAGGYQLLSRAPLSLLSGPASTLRLGPLVRVHPDSRTAALLPVLEVGLHYVNTGGLSRVGLQANASLLFPLARRAVWLGARVGYQQVFAFQEMLAFPTRDAGLLTFGLQLDFALFRQAPDRDGDRVVDDADACPEQAASGTVDGCPPGESPSRRLDEDPDGDGVLGAADRCPEQLEDRDNHQDSDGCPDPDNDGDAVLDAQDECVDQPGLVAQNGCPDTDGDGVRDSLDRCPKARGLANEQGCPRYKQVVITENKIEIKQKIFFAFGLPSILPRSFPLLDEVTQALVDRGSLCVRIEGHTDAKGGATANLKLSTIRAEAVREYLMKAGVGGQRLAAKGYGSTLPLDDNTTPEGREVNRRVEFVLVTCGEEGTR